MALVSKAFSDIITFSRGSAATRVNSAGRVESVAAGAPRFDYDPVTLAARGILIEEQRTNLLTYSQDFDNAAWAKVNSPTVLQNVATAPDGTVTADSIQAVTSGTFQYISQTASSTPNTTVTASIYVKKELSETVFGGIGLDFQGGTRKIVYVGFNSVTGAANNLVGASLTGALSVINCGNYWKLNVTATDNGGNTSCSFLYYANLSTDNINVAGAAVASSAKVIWGAQLEAGAFATSYIPSTVTFTGRSSTGTFIGSNGLIQTASAGVARYQYNPANLSVPPFLLLEAAATNLLPWSEDLSNAAWTKSNAFVQTNLLTYSQEFDNAAWNKNVSGSAVAPVVTANAGVAPDGTTTADRVQFNCGGSLISDRSSLVQPVTGLSLINYVGSVWIKANSPGEVGKQLRLAADGVLSPLIFTIPADWQRFTFSGTCTVTTGNNFILETRGTYTTNLTADVLVWGAQLVQGSVAGDYQATTSAAAAVQYVAPDGYRTAEKLVEDSTATVAHRVLNATAVTISTTGASAHSIYVKAAERTAVRLTDNDLFGADFDLLTGAVSNISAGVTPSAINAGNGWWRLSVIRISSTVNGRVVLYLLNGGSNTYTGDGTSGIYVWGAQIEAGSFATSYIPTTTASVTRSADTSTSAQTTRSADVASVNTLSPWFNATEGTLFASVSGFLAGTNFSALASITDNPTTGNWIELSGVTASTNATVSSGGASQASFTYLSSVASGGSVAVAYKANDFAAVVNGGTVAADVAGSVPSSVSVLRIGGFGSNPGPTNGHIRSIKYFPRRLSNAELVSLTA